LFTYVLLGGAVIERLIVWRRSMRLSAVLAVVSAICVLSTHAAVAGEAPTGVDSDSMFLRVAREVPQFGGAYVRDDNAVVIWLTEPSPELGARARKALVAEFGQEFAGSDIDLRRARYTFAQLHKWRAAATDVLSIDGVISTDNDERTNRLTITVEDNSRQRSEVEEALTAADVPLDAANIIEELPVRALPSTHGLARWLLGSAFVLLVTAVGLLLRRRSRRRTFEQVSATR
jgi:hypothetical protein